VRRLLSAGCGTRMTLFSRGLWPVEVPGTHAESSARLAKGVPAVSQVARGARSCASPRLGGGYGNRLRLQFLPPPSPSPAERVDQPLDVVGLLRALAHRIPRGRRRGLPGALGRLRFGVEGRARVRRFPREGCFDLCEFVAELVLDLRHDTRRDDVLAQARVLAAGASRGEEPIGSPPRANEAERLNEPGNWADASHPPAKSGDNVFDDHKDAAAKLEDSHCGGVSTASLNSRV
jgi:hypothetical protein